MQQQPSVVDRARVKRSKKRPRARFEFIDVATGEPVCPAPASRDEGDGSAPTGRIVADLEPGTVEVDPEDILSGGEGHPREARFEFDVEGGGVVDYRERARASAARPSSPKEPPKRPRAFRETFDSARGASAMFYEENALFFENVRDPIDGLRDWMDGVEVRVGRGHRRLSQTPAGRRILGQRFGGEAIRQAIAYVFGRATGRRWDDVDWDQVERMEASLVPYWEDPGSGPWAGAGTPGLYWRPLSDHRPSIDDLEQLAPDDREQFLRWQSSQDVGEALDELKAAYAKVEVCISPALREVVARRIEEWERWRLDPEHIPEYACEPDEMTGGFTCDYPSVAGELRELRSACIDGYDPDWALDESRRGEPGFPDTSEGPEDPRDETPLPVWDGLEGHEPLEGREPSPQTLESLRQLADDGEAYGANVDGVVDRRELGGILYQLEWRTCGSKNPKTGAAWCRCFAAYPGGGHGPYWYAYWREPANGRRKSRYIGKAFRKLEETGKAGGSRRSASP